MFYYRIRTWKLYGLFYKIQYLICWWTCNFLGEISIDGESIINYIDTEYGFKPGINEVAEIGYLVNEKNIDS